MIMLKQQAPICFSDSVNAEMCNFSLYEKSHLCHRCYGETVTNHFIEVDQVDFLHEKLGL